MTQVQEPLRILVCSIGAEHGNDYAFVRAFRRAGHSVKSVRPEIYAPPWEAKSLRIAYRLLQNRLAKEFNQQIFNQAQHFKPDFFFVFKGHLIFPRTISRLKHLGVVCIQFYPDVSFYNHGRYLPKTIDKYDWVFSTKPEHVQDLAQQFNYNNASFLHHAFNPEIHKPFLLTDRDRVQYDCDVSFIGNHSEGKEKTLRALIEARPALNLKIWGNQKWHNASPIVAQKFGGMRVEGIEYAKAIYSSKINLGLLLETVPSAGRGDSITARTFEIPACGGFMLHQRTDTVMHYFEEEKEIACFGDVDELVQKVDYYLAHEKERKILAKMARNRSLKSDYSVDNHMQCILTKYHEIHDVKNYETT